MRFRVPSNAEPRILLAHRRHLVGSLTSADRSADNDDLGLRRDHGTAQRCGVERIRTTPRAPSAHRAMFPADRVVPVTVWPASRKSLSSGCPITRSRGTKYHDGEPAPLSRHQIARREAAQR